MIGWRLGGLCQRREPLHTNHDRNQSINPPTRQPSGTALIQGTSRRPSWSQSQRGAGKMSHLSPIPVCLLTSAANRQEKEGRARKGTDSAATTGVAICELGGAADYRARGDTCSEGCVSRPASAGSSHQRQIEERQRWRRLSRSRLRQTGSEIFTL